MAITALDHAAANLTNTAGRSGRPAKPVIAVSNNPTTERSNAQLWLNIGFTRDDGKFINLPFGIAIDTMKFIEFKGQNQDWINEQDQRNALLEALQIKGDGLAAGDDLLLDGLELRLLRVKEKVLPQTNRKQNVTDILALIEGRLPQAAE